MTHIPDDDRYDEDGERRVDHHDEPLLARLGCADPARDLQPLSEEALRDLLGSVTVTDRTSAGEVHLPDTPDERGARDDRSRGDETAAGAVAAAATAEAPGSLEDLAAARRRQRRRQRRRWGGAGLGLAAAVAGLIALTTGPSGRPGTTGVTALQAAGPVAGGPAASCAQLEATSLSTFDVAFEGRVVQVRPVAAGEVVVLKVERVYRGDVEQRVEISTPGAGSLLDGTVSLVQGGDYLVAASEGQVAGCGATGLTSPELGALYVQAFGGDR